MGYCGNCGASMREGQRFCAKCGKSTGVPASLPGGSFNRPPAAPAKPFVAAPKSTPPPPPLPPIGAPPTFPTNPSPRPGYGVAPPVRTPSYPGYVPGAMYPSPPQPKKRGGKMVALMVALVVVLAGIGGVVWWFWPRAQSDDDSDTSSGVSEPTEPTEPTDPADAQAAAFEHQIRAYCAGDGKALVDELPDCFWTAMEQRYEVDRQEAEAVILDFFETDHVQEEIRQLEINAITPCDADTTDQQNTAIGDPMTSSQWVAVDFMMESYEPDSDTLNEASYRQFFLVQLEDDWYVYEILQVLESKLKHERP